MGHIQIRNVPPELHRKLKARAAAAGVSLSDYLLGIARREAESPTMDEIRERLAKLPPPPPSTIPSEDLIRADRDSR